MSNSSKWTPEDALPEYIKTQLQSSSIKSKNTPFLLFLNIIKNLKLQKRTGWVQYGITDAESISDHMYRMGIISMFAPSTIDSNRCVKIALVHDIAESIVGDITPVCPITKEEKHQRELDSVVYLRDLLKPFNEPVANELYELWNEYENISTKEARFVKDVDKFELLVQCVEEEKRMNKTKDLSIFLEERKKIESAEVQSWVDDLLKDRELYWT